jgi:hypothetical protein
MSTTVVDEVYAAKALLAQLAQRQWWSWVPFGLVRPFVLMRRGPGRPVVLAVPLTCVCCPSTAEARTVLATTALHWLTEAYLVELGPWVGSPFEMASVTVTRAGMRAWRSGRMIVSLAS